MCLPKTFGKTYLIESQTSDPEQSLLFQILVVQQKVCHYFCFSLRKYFAYGLAQTLRCRALSLVPLFVESFGFGVVHPLPYPHCNLTQTYTSERNTLLSLHKKIIYY